MFAELARVYLEAINGGAVPTISTAWDAVVQAECRRALQAAVQTFDEQSAIVAWVGYALSCNWFF